MDAQRDRSDGGTVERGMVYQNGRTERDRAEVALKFALIGIQPSHLLYWHHTCYLDDEAAVAFFIGVRHCGRTNLAGIEASIPAEVAVGSVGEFFGGEWDPSSFRRHPNFAFLRRTNGAHEPGGTIAAGKAEGTQASEKSLAFTAG